MIGERCALIVRHAKAGDRRRWVGDDRLRPLSQAGRGQAADLVAVLALFRPARLLSSPYVRCVETLQPLAGHLRMEIEARAELSEGGEAEGAILLSDPAGPVVACTHGDVVPALLEVLGLVSADGFPCAKASVWVVTFAANGVAARYLPPPPVR